MIQILDKKACCGCNACVQICPQQCIEMTADEQGFLYPKVQQEACIHCGLCEAVCPVIHPKPSRTPLGVYAAKCKKERIRLQSSSGGIFTLLAEKTIQDGGVVFGVRFNQQWEAVHDYTETIEGLAAFRGSKYVQSRVGNSFQQARSFLTEGRQVLFSGTPCQIAGLKNFLRKAYSNLCTVDIVCHGVPSPMIWKMYLTKITATEEKKMAAITHITFRDKSMGWRNYHLCMEKEKTATAAEILLNQPNSINLYLKGFIQNLYLRPSCSSCPTRGLSSGSDLTIADYWGIDKIAPQLDDDKGTSLVMLHTDKIKIEQLDAEWQKTDYSSCLPFNPAIVQSDALHKKSELFYREVTTDNLLELIERYTKTTRSDKVIAQLKRKLKSLLHGKRKL